MESHLAQYDKQYHRKVLLNSFHLNGHTLGTNSWYKNITKAARWMLASARAQPNIFLCPIRDKHLNEMWNWFFESSVPRTLSSVLENFRGHFFPTQQTTPGPGLRGLFSQTQKLEPPCTAYQKIPQESAVWIAHHAVADFFNTLQS